MNETMYRQIAAPTLDEVASYLYVTPAIAYEMSRETDATFERHTPDGVVVYRPAGGDGQGVITLY